MAALVKPVSYFRAEVSDVPGCEAAFPMFRRSEVPSSSSIKQSEAMETDKETRAVACSRRSPALTVSPRTFKKRNPNINL